MNRNTYFSKGFVYSVRPDGITCALHGGGVCAEKELVIPDVIDGYRKTDVFESAFCYCVASIADGAFRDTAHLTAAVIPDSVTEIGAWAFSFCGNLTSAVIPDSVTCIGEGAFSYGKRLASAVIPDSVTYIGEGAFAGAGALIVSPDHPNYLSDGGALYSGDGKTLLHYDATSAATEFRIPDSVTRIGNGAFVGCESLVSIFIPDSVTEIGESAFRDCVRLAEAVIPDSVTDMGARAFFGCLSLRTAVIGRSVKRIGEGAFAGCVSLASMELPDSVTGIGFEAFSGCVSLASLIIPASVTSIGEKESDMRIDGREPDFFHPLVSRGVFNNCKNLKDLVYKGTKKQWKAIRFGYGLAYSWRIYSYVRSVECMGQKRNRVISFEPMLKEEENRTE